MIPKECKRLAEVDFPIAEVSRHSAREKSIRHGHPSTLHLWWARRPLAACRAVLLALLLPDPCDPLCPPEFKEKARRLLAAVPRQMRPSVEAPKECDRENYELRRALLGFIAAFANWDYAANPLFIETARELVRAATPEPPLVVDPFAGGGSIPLEALRLGCEAFASDLNPVACLILKVLLEDIPRYGRAKIRIPTAEGDAKEVEGLAEAVRKVGALVKARAEEELAEFYPSDADGARPIAYLWARTVRCEAPNCGAEIPLARSFWLSKRTGRQRALRYQVERPKGLPPEVVFEVFEPDGEAEVPKGTVSRGNATCPACGTVLRVDRVRAQLSAQRGGADVVFDERGRRIGGARLLAVVTIRRGEQGRHYRLPTESDYAAVHRATQALAGRTKEPLPGGLSPVPDEPIPFMSGTFNVPLYGIQTWGDLFTARQKIATLILSELVRELGTPESKELLAFAISGICDHNSSLCSWRPNTLDVGHTFGRQALPVSWDFAEVVPAGESTGSLSATLDRIARVTDVASKTLAANGQTQVADAARHPLPDDAANVWFTDPPYYFAVPYADLSDFFFVWLKRALPGYPLMRDPFDPINPLTPKAAEICQMAHWDLERYSHKDQGFFEDGMARAFREGRRVLQDDGIGAVVFAHKTTEGWEALLSGLIRAGWVVTASWPITTEMAARLRARESAALAASVHLIIRPRPETARVGDWGDVLRELPKRVGDWMPRLQSEGIRGADLVFACIGPALEIFSRYSSVETPEGREVGLPEFLVKVWEVVGRAALAQVLGTGEHGAGALEEDARLTALFLWTLQSTNGTAAGNGKEESDLPAAPNAAQAGADEGAEEDEEEGDAPRLPGWQAGRKAKGFTLVFDIVRRFAQPLGIHLADWEKRIIETEKGVVRLLPVSERTRQLFGEDGAHAVAERLEAAAVASPQQFLFPEMDPVQTRPRGRPGRRPRVDVTDESLQARREATTLDRVHAAMLLQASGRASALRNLLRAEQERGPEFLRLANALSALYPRDSEEKRLLDAMLLAVPK